MSIYGRVFSLNKKVPDIQTQKSNFSHQQKDLEKLSIQCKKHSNQFIIFICTAKNCENHLLCPECILNSPSLLIKYKENILTLQDYFEASNTRLLLVKIEREFQGIETKIRNTIETAKQDVKKVFSGNLTGNDKENALYDSLENNILEKVLEKEKIYSLDTENIQKFIKESQKYDQLKKGYHNNIEDKSPKELKYFEFLTKFKLQVDVFCKSLQKQVSEFLEVTETQV